MTSSPRSPLLPITAMTLMITIFLVDAFTSLDIAIAVLYVIVVLLAAAVWPHRIVLCITIVCLALTTIAYLFSHGLMFSGNPLARFVFSLIAISITAFLALKGQAATARLLEREDALHRSQAQLAHVTRVTMLGELAASIAHEVNQPLSAIATNGAATLRWLNRPEPDMDEARAAVGNIINDTRRASEVIKRIRALSRKTESEYAPVNINEIARESVALVQRELNRNGVQLQLELTELSYIVQGDRIQLQQVIINLMVNAMQAMVHNGQARRTVSLSTSRGERDEIVVEVSDTGPGIDPSDTARLFEAFYTTKEKGMGMGLSICRSIVEAHGGRIWAQNKSGKTLSGATFCFALPIVLSESP